MIFEIHDSPEFEVEIEKSSSEYARIYCLPKGILVIDIFGFRTVS